jgi:hypothetical protein
VYYKTAGLLQFRHRGKRQVYEEVLRNDALLFSNPAYTELFKQVAPSATKDFIRTEDREIERLLDRHNVFLALDSLMLSDSNFSNQALNQAMLLYHFRPTNKDERFKPEIRTFYRHEAEKLGANSIVQTIAKNQKTGKSKGIQGKEAYPLNFEDRKGNPVGYATDRYTYVTFYKSNSDESEREMLIVNKLYREYGDACEFIHISLDENQDDYHSFLKSYKDYKWTFAWFAYDRDLVEELDLRQVPMHFLVTPNGRYMWDYTPAPIDMTGPLLNMRKQLRQRNNRYYFIEPK